MKQLFAQMDTWNSWFPFHINSLLFLLYQVAKLTQITLLCYLSTDQTKSHSLDHTLSNILLSFIFQAHYFCVPSLSIGFNGTACQCFVFDLQHYKQFWSTVSFVHVQFLILVWIITQLRCYGRVHNHFLGSWKIQYFCWDESISWFISLTYINVIDEIVSPKSICQYKKILSWENLRHISDMS